MSLISFLKDAGERLFKHQPAPLPTSFPTARPAAAPGAAPVAAKPDVDALNREAGDAILAYIKTKNLPADKLTLSYDGSKAAVIVAGEVPDQAAREKIVLCCGNVHGVEQVDDRMTVAKGGDVSEYYTVKGGDTLSKIAQHAYGAANRYNEIFEANKPMLSDPDKIYPGQVLRIPKTQA